MSSTPPELNHIMVRAGAGAGKTTGLVKKVSEVYAQFRNHGQSPRIVLTTFTRKATQELKERLIQKACAERDPEFLQFVSDPSRLQISTIHGLLNIFLRQIGHLAGLDAGFQIISGGDSHKLTRQALREALLENPEGLRFFEVYGFERVLQMCQAFALASLEQGPLQPVSLEDLERATREVMDAYRAELKEFSARVLEEVDFDKWREFAEALAAFADEWNGDPANLEALPQKPRRPPKNNDYGVWYDDAETLLKRFKEELKKPIWNKDLWVQMVEEWSAFSVLGEVFTQRFKSLKESQAVLEMSDLELKSLEILRAKPFLGQIFSESWDFWMIDEFQDTSPLQVEILKRLIGEKPCYFVGDPQQSIYLFRGSDVGVFERTQGEVEAKGGEFQELKQNWRSNPDLLLWINDFMTGISSAFSAMKPRVEPTPPERECVLIVRAPTPEAEMDAVLARVVELVQAGARLEQICVLGRTHKNLMAVSAALRAQGYPTHVHAARGFSQRREVQDALFLWKFLINPHDNINLAQLLRSPWFFTDDSWLAQQMSSRPNSLWTHLHASQDHWPSAILALKKATDQVAELGVVRTFEETLLSASYLDLCLQNDPAGRKESNLWKLLMKARDVERRGGNSLLDLLDAEDLSDPMESNEGDASSAQEPNCIHLMTIHGAKGLEFDHVLVPRMGEAPVLSKTPPLQAEGGRFSFSIPVDDEVSFVSNPVAHLQVRRMRERESEEFDRCLYVALTRAKETLMLSASEIVDRSWASRSRDFSAPPDLYEKDYYRYRIHEDLARPQPFSRVGGERRVRAPYQQGEKVLETHRSVTELVARESKKPSAEDLIRRWEAQSKGTRIHKALESVKYKGRWEGEFDEAIDFVLKLNEPPMAELIRSGFVEWGFQVKTPSGLIEGQIDLWSKHEGRIFIVDYKSGSPAFEEEAFRQLSLYAWALRRFGHKEPIDLVVIYPLRAKVTRREFSEDLFRVWESEFGGAQAAR